MNISGNTVLITGGATGIGYAFAEKFLAANNHVVICGRREDRLLGAKKNLPELLFKISDLTRNEDRKELIEWAASSFDGFNVLINNAGIQRDIDFTRGADELVSGEDEIRINLEAPIALSAMAIPCFAGKKEAAIINVSSGLAFVPAARMPVYSATKAALHAFSMALRHQLAKIGIKVFEIVPPAVDTELNPEGRAKRGNFKAGLTSGEFVSSVMKSLQADVFEIGYGTTEASLRASRSELDESFRRMNTRW